MFLFQLFKANFDTTTNSGLVRHSGFYGKNRFPQPFSHEGKVGCVVEFRLKRKLVNITIMDFNAIAEGVLKIVN
jgi:hypothetical protein